MDLSWSGAHSFNQGSIEEWIDTLLLEFPGRDLGMLRPAGIHDRKSAPVHIKKRAIPNQINSTAPKPQSHR